MNWLNRRGFLKAFVAAPALTSMPLAGALDQHDAPSVQAVQPKPRLLKVCSDDLIVGDTISLTYNGSVFLGVVTHLGYYDCTGEIARQRVEAVRRYSMPPDKKRFLKNIEAESLESVDVYGYPSYQWVAFTRYVNHLDGQERPHRG